MDCRRGPDRPEKQPDPGVGANRQPASGTQGSRLRLGLSVWRGRPVGRQSLPSRKRGAAALIMPICNTAAMNHHLIEISSQVTTPRFREGRLCPRGGDPRRRQLAPQPRARGARQYHLIAVAALQPRAQSGRADLALSAQSPARQLGISRPGTHHGRLRNRLAAVRRRPRLDPLALRGRLGSGVAPSLGCLLSNRGLREKYTHVQKFPEIGISFDPPLDTAAHKKFFDDAVIRLKA